MNIKTTFLQGFRVSTVLGLLSLLLVSPLMFVPQASADTLLVSASMTASPGTICIGQSTHLNWTSTDATSIFISPGVGSVNPYGELDVYPTQTTTYTITASNTSGGYGSYNTGSITVYVTGPCTTASPTPTPTGNTLYCAATYGAVNSGDLVTFNAWGGDGNYSWNTYEGTPSYGYGSSFSSRFYNATGYSVNRNVTVTSGYQVTTCGVTVYSSAVYTPTPTPAANAQVQLTKTGRNVTRGQSGEYTSISARAGDTLDFVIRIRSTTGAYLYNTYVTDLLPVGITYIPGSTTLNGLVTANGVTSSGLNVGTLSPYAETVVKFSARVEQYAVPTLGTVTVNNTVQVRADGLVTRSASLPITLGQNISITTVSTVKTGPADSLWLALATALFATAGYAAYTRSNAFGRRMAYAEVSRLAQTAGPNFAK